MYITKDGSNIQKARISFDKIIKDINIKGLKYTIKNYGRMYSVVLHYKKYEIEKTVICSIINIPLAFKEFVTSSMKKVEKFECLLIKAKKEIKTHNKRYSENLKINIDYELLNLKIDNEYKLLMINKCV